MEYIPLDYCRHGFLYRIHSRNLRFGVFDENARGFMGIREDKPIIKDIMRGIRRRTYSLFLELHWDASERYGTAIPEEELKHVPEGMPLENPLRIIDKHTGRPVAFGMPLKDGGRGWYFLDTSEASEGISAQSVQNDALLDWLKDKEQEYGR